MASFSQRLLLRPCIRARSSTTASTARFFTTTSLRVRAGAGQAAAAQAKKPHPAAAAAAAPPPKATATAIPSRYAFVKSLATKPTPTTLYEAPSHFWFYFGCWTSGLTLVAWTALTAPAVINQPEGVPRWVGVVYGSSYLLLSAMGFYLISKTPNIVGSIRLLPSGLAAGGRSVAPPRLEVTVKRMVPLLAPKVITTSLDSVALKSRLSLPDECVPELRRKEKEAQLRKADMEHLLTMPFRRLGRGFANLFRGIRAAWTDMGYGVISVDGQEYKVDVTKGFAHDGFRTLERIVPIGYK